MKKIFCILFFICFFSVEGVFAQPRPSDAPGERSSFQGIGAAANAFVNEVGEYFGVSKDSDGKLI